VTCLRMPGPTITECLPWITQIHGLHGSEAFRIRAIDPNRHNPR
jgi:hypothetical protein